MSSVLETAKSAWVSKRLVYRPFEDQDPEVREWMHEHIENDPVVEAMISGGLLKPATKQQSDRFTDMFPTALLSVAVCLPAEAEYDMVETTEVDKREAVAKDSAKKKPTMIGYVVLQPVAASIMRHRSADLAVALADAYQGQGYGGEALNWIIDWGFRHANLHRVGLGVFSYNEHALSLYKKLGFVIEGRERESVLFDRKWHDKIRMGMLEGEWEEMRKKTVCSTCQ